ncbi:ABC transporter ATP-binding protein, partial [Rhizobium ruizarguesonis]
LPTQQRNIAQVFQFPVIYDTMTVYDNLAFPLRNLGVAEPYVDRRVREILEMIDLADWAKRRAHEAAAERNLLLLVRRQTERATLG